MNKRYLLAVASTGSAVLLLCGWLWLARYSSTPGSQGDAPRHMPAALKEVAGAQPLRKPVMFVALHPQCTCSRATMHELSRVLTEAGGGKPDIYLLMYRPAVLLREWDGDGVLPALASGLGAHVIQDVNGRYAAALEASTSGEVILYSKSDDLLFQGGVTALRGHEGRSASADRLQAALRYQTPFQRAASVFGCPIVDHS